MKSLLLDISKIKNLYSGLGHVGDELAKGIAVQAQQEWELKYLLPKRFEDRYGSKVSYFFLKAWRKIINSRIKADVWHMTSADSRYEFNRKSKLLLTIHDLNFLTEKSGDKLEKRKQRLQKKINQASAITAISAFTKNEVLKHMKVPEGKEIQVIYNGVANPTERPASQPAVAKGEHKPFFFTIGAIMWKKNFHTLIPMMKHFPEHELWIAGKGIEGDYGKKISLAIQEQQLGDRVKMIGEISNEEKNWAYQNCEAFLFPSLLEGFGIPPIEAMYCGKPAFLANRTSLPEIGGKLAYYWDDFEADDMAKVVTAGLADFNAKTDGKELLVQHASQFSWSNTISEYIALYDQLAKQ